MKNVNTWTYGRKTRWYQVSTSCQKWDLLSMGSIVLNSGEMIKGNPNDSNMLIPEKNTEPFRVIIGQMYLVLWFSSILWQLSCFTKTDVLISNNIIYFCILCTFFDLYIVQLKYTTIFIFKDSNRRYHILLLLNIFWNLVITVYFLITFVIILLQTTYFKPEMWCRYSPLKCK